MNVILVLVDSLNRHALAAYGPSQIASPNLDAFAQRAWRCDRHFVGSLPCMPARREIFAGFKEMMWRPWGSLEPFDDRLPKLLENHGYTTGMVTDHYHYWEEAANGYMQSFQNVQMIRGHEFDFWKHPIADNEPVPQWVENIEKYRPGEGRWYYANVKDFRTEEDFFPAKVMTTATAWLDEHASNTPFFLQVESFDVHEPFHVPEPYASMYANGTDLDRFNIWPPYQNRQRQAEFMADTTEEELEFLRAQYAGKLTMVDRWFGELTKTLDRLDLWDDTMVIVTTDHGHDLGERGVFGKMYPHWDTHAHLPMFVWHPTYPGNGQTLSGLTTTIDLFATVLDAAGAPVPERTHSHSILPMLEDPDARVHEAVLYGTFGQGVCCTDGEWTIFKSPTDGDHAFYSYSALLAKSLGSPPGSVPPIPRPTASGDYIPGADLPQWQVPRRHYPVTNENFLFRRSTDPGQRQNLWDDEPAERERMLKMLTEYLEALGTPPEQFVRLGLRPAEL